MREVENEIPIRIASEWNPFLNRSFAPAIGEVIADALALSADLPHELCIGRRVAALG